MTILVALGAALVRAVVVAICGTYLLSATNAYGEVLSSIEIARLVLEDMLILLVLLIPVAVGAFIAASAYVGLNGRPFAVSMLRAAYSAGILDALAWASLAIVLSSSTWVKGQRDPSVGCCVLPIMAAMCVRIGLSICLVGFYAVAWRSVERPEHQSWLRA